jgi:cytochrome P450
MTTRVPVFNPTDPEQLADLLGTYRSLRAHAPVQKTPIAGGTWLLTRYEDIRGLLRETDALMSPPGRDPAAPLAGGPAERIYRGLMVLNDPPVHTRIRRLAEIGLSRKGVSGLRERIGAVVDEALDAVQARGEVEAISELAFVVPLRVICGFLGIPAVDRRRLLEWTPDFFRIFIPAANDADGIAACHRACQNYIDYMSDLIAYRRARPQDDLFTALIQAEEIGQRLSPDELVSTVLSLLTGGFDTTMGMIGAGLYNLALQPEQFQKLRGDPTRLATPAVEEFIRWESPVGMTLRHFPRDMPVGDTVVPAGETVWMALLSANHDPTRFEDPDRIDIERPDNRHLAFGGFRHFCLGNNLARLEGEVTFERVARRWRSLEIAGAAPRRLNFQFRSISELPLRFEAA